MESIDEKCFEILCKNIEFTLEYNKKYKNYSEIDIFESNLICHNITNYINYIMILNKCHKSLVFISIIYLQRIKSFYKGFRLIYKNFHKFFITAMLVATKMYEDLFYNNLYWAKKTNISLQELNELEIEFLYAIKFDLVVTEEEYNDFISFILK